MTTATGSRDDVIALLRQVSLFATLSDDLLNTVARVCEPVRLDAGNWLFRQGQPEDGLYILASGRLEIVMESATGAEAIVRDLRPGEPVGELALLRSGTRQASVRALRHSELWRIERRHFSELLAASPSFAHALLSVLAEKVSVAPAPPQRRRLPRVIGSVALQPGLAVREMVGELERTLTRYGRVAVLEAPEAPVGDNPEGTRDETSEWGRLLDRCERNNDWVILAAEQTPTGDAWAKFALAQADRILCLIDPKIKPPDWTSTDELQGCDLAFLANSSSVSGSSAWVSRLAPRSHHWIGTWSPQGFPRLARRLAGHAVGVVLSGGGARGLAHIGALDALEEAGLAIDRVGGVSIGAFIGSLYAGGASPAELRELCNKELVHAHPFADYTVPRFGFIKGRRAEQMMHRLFGDQKFEHLNRGMFCLSADLISAESVVHRWGHLAPAVGASMRIPGIAPPASTAGRLLVDGGILNNLPVDVMADDAEGPVIAIDVMRRPPGRGGQTGDVPSDPAIPGVIETLARTAALTGWSRGRANALLADLVISPDVDGIGMFEWRRIDGAIEKGRRAALDALAASTPTAWSDNLADRRRRA